MKIITKESCTSYHSPGHPERPARVQRTVAHLREFNDLGIEWLEPEPCEDTVILRAHSPQHLARLDQPEDFDADTPYFDSIGKLARDSVGAALTALRLAREGHTVFSLMRPPGHHATPDRAMGFCYLNNIAIAVLEALATGSKRVAVFDFDVHHGNGTEAVLLNRKGTGFFSVHEWPCYPGTGSENVGDNCFNFPVTPGTPRAGYDAILKKAFDALTGFKPDLVAVSAGFDGYARDPLAGGTLEAEDYHWLGTLFHDMDVPVFSLLEGGYSSDLPKLIEAYLRGLQEG